MTVQWTVQQVLELSPDAGSAQAGKGLARFSQWASIGRSDRALWGEIRGSGKNSYQVRIDLSEPAFKCSCPSRKFPCKHGLGLFLILAEDPASIPQDEAPAWVQDWITQRDGRREERAERVAQSREVDTEAQAKRARQREKRVRTGIDELSLWLADLVRQGLGAAQSRPTSFWREVAARMVDAQAPGLARHVRQLGETVSSGEGWQSRMLASIGRLHLLIQAYGRLELLPAPLCADVRAAIGWTTSIEELLEQEKHHDTWIVLGQRTEREEQLRVQRTWLWGLRLQRPALILQFAAGTQGFETTLSVGTQFDGDLIFYPSADPLRAMLASRNEKTESCRPIPMRTVPDAMEEAARAIALQPWIETWPLRLGGVVPHVCHQDGAARWSVQDGEGRTLSLHARFGAGWQLAAISGGTPIDLFGEWDGETLLPTSAVSGQRFFALLGGEGAAALVRVA